MQVSRDQRGVMIGPPEDQLRRSDNACFGSIWIYLTCRIAGASPNLLASPESERDHTRRTGTHIPQGSIP